VYGLNLGFLSVLTPVAGYCEHVNAFWFPYMAGAFSLVKQLLASTGTNINHFGYKNYMGIFIKLISYPLFVSRLRIYT
jgi:hypothetical protein